MLTSRIDQLKKQFFTHVPAVCLEGALSKTHVFKETEGEPMIVRRAKAFKRHCETKTITIQPGELVVGNAGRTARTIHICPELSNNWVYEELDTMATRPQDPYAITEEQKMLFRNEIYPYWKGKTLRDYWNAQAPKPILDIISVGGVIDNDIKIECTPGDIVPEFKENIFAKGFGGIRAQAQALLETVDLNDVENYDRRDFWEAITITCDGFSILCRRHAQAARELAATEKDGTRKAELLGMAEACDAIAENPPKTFREAMQLHYFIFVGLFIEGNAGGYSPGRMDQNLYPYYKRDVEAGILTDAEALELIECMWIKFGEQIWYWNEPAATHYAGFCAFQNVCIGGVDMDGLDAVNPLSYLMLQATIDTQMVQPSLSVRLSRKNPEDFFLKIAELIQTGSGFPAIYSDDIGMKQLMKKGIPPELARDWVGLGCVEANMPGKMSQWSSAGHYNIAAAVEFALSNGVHLKSGKKLGLETGDPASFTTFEQFRDAVHAQLDHLLRTFSSMQNLLELLHQRYLPNPVASMVLLDCVEKGKDLMRGGARYNTGPGMNGNGVADYADSMVAVKKLVFDEKKVDMATLADAVKHDFKGYEPLLRLIDEEAPKWGNDDPEADAMVIDLTSFIIKKIAAFRGLLGNQKLPALYPVSSNVPQGMAVGALPSGRRAFRPIAEGCSPCQGADRTGPTAVLRSLGKLPHTCIDGGTLLNLKFTPASVEGEAGRIRLSAFLKSFLDLDVFHVQFNVVGHEVLRCAQAHPEEYKSLLVRVAGYSAYFVELSREVQDDILSRTVNTL